MSRALLIIAAVIVLGSAALIVIVLVALAAFGIRCMFGPGFDEYGYITECIGCPHAGEYCRGCRYNPEYWDHTKYTGPSHRELRRLRKEEERT